MTDEKQPEVPPWLEPCNVDGLFVLAPGTRVLVRQVVRTADVDFNWFSREDYAAWRSRIAEALDMVEPGSLRDRASLADELVLQERECHAVCTRAGVPMYPRTGEGVYSLAQRIEMLREKAIAAELRRQADEIDPGPTEEERKTADEKAGEWIAFDERVEIAAQLRARADELDGGAARQPDGAAHLYVAAEDMTAAQRLEACEAARERLLKFVGSVDSDEARTAVAEAAWWTEQWRPLKGW